MFERVSIFTKLARRLQHGDWRAYHQLRQRLEPELVRMVRHALEDRTSVLARRILAHIGCSISLAVTKHQNVREKHIRGVASVLCERIMARLHAETAVGKFDTA